MKQLVSVTLLLLIFTAAIAQPKTRGKVRRKYRNIDQVIQHQQQTTFRGLVRDVNKVPIAGASVEVEGFERLVHTNENGEFTLTGLPAQRVRIKITSLGYRTKLIDYVMGEGFNDHYIALDRTVPDTERNISSAQKREQHLPDIPSGVSAINRNQADKLNVYGLKEMADFFPMMFFENVGAGKTGFSIAGGTVFTDFAAVPSSVSVFLDGTPVLQNNGLAPVLFDVERLEVIKGSQNVLFGADAAYGAVNLVNKKPDFLTHGVISIGGGNYGNVELRGMVNTPLVKNKLAVRAAALYDKSDGFLSNLQGGKLQGVETLGSRMSLRFVPAFNQQLDVSLDYLKHESTGIGFINTLWTDPNGVVDLKNLNVSLNSGHESGSELETMNANLHYRYYFDAHKYFSFISSFRTAASTDRRDADGTPLPAFDVDNTTEGNLIYNEIRYNYSVNSRLNGSVGINYKRERGNHHYNLSSSDSLINKINGTTVNALNFSEYQKHKTSKSVNTSAQISDPLSDQHFEELVQENIRSTAQAFLHLTYQIKPQWFLTGGISAFYDHKQLNQQSDFTGGEPSALGTVRNAVPNVLFKPASGREVSSKVYYLAGQAGITYRWNETFNVFGNVSSGRKPQILLFTWDSQPLIEKAEIIKTIDGGWNWVIKERVFWDGYLLYRQHHNMHVPQWDHPSGTSLLISGGKGVSGGAETGLNASVVKGVDIYGRYGWIYSKFDSTGVDGTDFIYAGNSFARTPQHSYTAGINFHAQLIKGLSFEANTWYSRKSHFWFTDANISELYQPGYGVLNARVKLNLETSGISLTIYGENLLDERFISSAGHIGGIVGLHTIVPGQPRLVGAKISWGF
ncbi:MAG TPA: TonB-dependent receptor [Mariniphaga sp.]|nr:TonB-dependent receptor [Mariniphaga sp.]